ncbi:tetratricopeptide repeat protein [Variovorax sp. LARHSF232]
MPAIVVSWLALVLLAPACSTPAGAAPRVPSGDSAVVETLPVLAAWPREERRLRRQLAQRPGDEASATAAAQAYLALAREQGDARFAGHAMGALQAWNARAAAETPVAVLLMRATVAQFLHDFDGAEADLEAALARQPGNAQAWLTLATILRVRGRYAESDAACRAVGRYGPAPYGVACQAENAGLRGEHGMAREALRGLLAEQALQGPQQAAPRQWILTSLAEVEELAGRPAAAEAAYRQALALAQAQAQAQAESSGYLLLAYGDFLLQQERPAEVPPLLDKAQRSDAVLLRLAIAERRTGAEPVGSALARELHSRLDAAALRPGTAALHAREAAVFALDVQGDARRAVELARTNVLLQREPFDLLLLSRAAFAARDAEALREARALALKIGLSDARIDAIPSL